MDKFAQELDKLITKLRSAIFEVRFRAQNTLISNVDSPPDEVLEYINKQLVQVDKLQHQAFNYTKYQEIFKVAVTKFVVFAPFLVHCCYRYDELEETANDLQLKQLLWQSFVEWKELERVWKGKPFEEINADEVL